MRINVVQNNMDFKALHIRNSGNFYYRACDISRCKEQLADTKFLDLIIDSHGLAIKEKKTDILNRIQSFSLYPKENSVSVNMIGEKKHSYKFIFKTLQEAKANWKLLASFSKGFIIDEYTEIILWLEKQFIKNK